MFGSMAPLRFLGKRELDGKLMVFDLAEATVRRLGGWYIYKLLKNRDALLQKGLRLRARVSVGRSSVMKTFVNKLRHELNPECDAEDIEEVDDELEELLEDLHDEDFDRTALPMKIIVVTSLKWPRFSRSRDILSRRGKKLK
jgi:hypothetical protein